MSYSSNMLENGSLELNNLSNWTATNVGIGAIYNSTEKYFVLGTNSSIKQIISNLAFTLQPVDCKLAFDFRFTHGISSQDKTIDAFARIEYTYVDGDVESFTIPITPSFYSTILKSDGTWYELEVCCPIKENAVLQQISVELKTTDLSGNCFIRDISVQRSLTDAEVYDINSQLPLSITVSQEEGIKAVKGDDVTFWLNADGSAYFSGQIQATSGVFGTDVDTQIKINSDGTVTIPMLTITGLDDLDSTVNGWMVEGTTTINGANIATGTISADKIAANSLIVGTNVQMGPNAVITWDNLDEEARINLTGPQGPEGPQGPPGDAATNIPDWVYAWNSGNTKIAAGYILSPKIFLGQGGQMTTGVKVDLDGIISYSDSKKNGFSLSTLGVLELYNKDELTAEIKFDTAGAGSASEDAERVFLSTYNGYALKVQTVDANMSLVAGGVIGSGYKVYIGDAVFMGTVEGIEGVGSAVATFG